MTACLVAHLNARQVLTGSRTSKLARVVQGCRKTSGATTLGRQRREPFNDSVAALG